MLYDTMQPEFIVKLSLLGALSAGCLLGSVLLLHRARWDGYKVSAAICLLSCTCASTGLFIRVTAPTAQLRDMTTAFFYAAALAALCSVGATLYFYFFKLEKAASKQITLDVFDMIDDCAMIFDDRGELAARNVHPEIDAMLARAMTLNDMIGLLPDTAADLLRSQGKCDARLANRDFYIRMVPVFGSRREQLGTLALWRDISVEMRLKEELDEQNRRISAQGDQLIQELQIEEALLAQREKQEMAALIQAELTVQMDDTLQKIRLMQGEAVELTKLQTQVREVNLKSIAQELRAMLSEIRKFVYETKKETRR